MKTNRFGIDINAPFILGMGALSLIILVIGMATPLNMVNLFGAYRTAFSDPMQYVRLFTHILVHANLSHFAGNFMMILAIGPMVEEKYGFRALLLITVITAFVTGLINVVFWPGRAVVGASGIVFMLILLASFTNIRQGRLPITVPLVAILYIGNEILQGLFTEDNISQLSHIIGGICGAVFGLVFHFKK
ncbi:MAG: rhomboid family intramembrane serine protease [Oscillospiraceae bacterium]|nr:rhomboid family intramembrane serine protease [Oscillospiraceae bacterium]